MSSTQYDTPLVSAIVPVFQAEAFLSPTLASLQAQTWPNIEIIIGDDASPDGTVDVIRDFVSRNQNAKAILREENLGWIRNTNDLLAAAKGVYIFFLAHDDTIEPNYVERLVAALKESPDAVLAYSDLDWVGVGRPREVLRFQSLHGVSCAARRARQLLSMRGHWWVPYRGVFRADAYSRLGGLQSSKRIGQIAADWTWLFELALIGKFVRVPEVLYHKVAMVGSLGSAWKAPVDVKLVLLLLAAKLAILSDARLSEKLSIISSICSALALRSLYIIARLLALRILPRELLARLRPRFQKIF